MADPAPAPDAAPRFPWWIPAGALALSLAYLPTLAAPFDFVDDGNLVYPAPAGTTVGGHARLWWASVVQNVEHLGPFRPALWFQWHVQANLFGADPLVWRAARLLWCALAAAALLWLFRELRVPPVPALLAGAAAMWNPYRNEVWTSLTLSEGVAMPYALVALVAARRAANARRPLPWDAVAVAGLLFALGCKNTFAALVPAMIVLRVWPDGASLRDGWRAHRLRAAVLLLPLALPLAHFVYFKVNWHPGQYAAGAPTAGQLVRFLQCLKGAAGLDFLGAALGLAALLLLARVWHRPGGTADSETAAVPRKAVICGALLVAAGTAVYLPVNIISGRYAMPAVWGLDVLFAVLLVAAGNRLSPRLRVLVLVAFGAGLAVTLGVNVHRQHKATARARLLWQVVHHLEAHAPPGATVAWISGDPARGELGVEEGIHVQWHLDNRGRKDVRILLLDAHERPLPRVEIAAADEAPALRVDTRGEPGHGWAPGRRFVAVYLFGQKRYDCYVDVRHPAGIGSDPHTQPRTPSSP